MSLLLRVLRDIEAARHLSPAEWDLLVRQCRHANLLGRLHLRLEAAGIPVPERARNWSRSDSVRSRAPTPAGSNCWISRKAMVSSSSSTSSDAGNCSARDSSEAGR